MTGSGRGSMQAPVLVTHSTSRSLPSILLLSAPPPGFPTGPLNRHCHYVQTPLTCLLQFISASSATFHPRVSPAPPQVYLRLSLLGELTYKQSI